MALMTGRVVCCCFVLLVAAAWAVTAARAESPTEPAATATTLSEETRLELFLLVGQSNMAGRGKIEDQDRAADPRVWVLNADSRWVPATDPLHFDKPQIAGVGLGLTFGKLVAAATRGVAVGLVPCAVGGTSIDQWRRDGKLYQEALRRAREAAKHGTFKAILWHQGESDSGTLAAAEAYPAKLRQLILDFRADLGSPDLPFVSGQLGEFHQTVRQPANNRLNELLMDAAKEIPHYACASSAGLKSVGDNTHFDSASLRQLGRRYADAYFGLVAGSRATTRPSGGR